ncbi:MAG: transposase [Flavobacteriales bacterium Tduv]
MNKTRWVVERSFSSIKRSFGSGKTRYKGLACVHRQHLMDDMGIICIVSVELLCTVHKKKI